MAAATWDWKVTKTSFARLEIDLKQLASWNYLVYQIVAVQEVKPARVPFEVIIISRRTIKSEYDRQVAENNAQFAMSYSPPQS